MDPEPVARCSPYRGAVCIPQMKGGSGKRYLFVVEVD